MGLLTAMLEKTAYDTGKVVDSYSRGIDTFVKAALGKMQVESQKYNTQLGVLQTKGNILQNEANMKLIEHKIRDTEIGRVMDISEARVNTAKNLAMSLFSQFEKGVKTKEEVKSAWKKFVNEKPYSVESEYTQYYNAPENESYLWNELSAMMESEKQPNEATDRDILTNFGLDIREPSLNKTPTVINSSIDFLNEASEIVAQGKSSDKSREEVMSNLITFEEQHPEFSKSGIWENFQGPELKKDIKEIQKRDKYGFLKVDDWSDPDQYEPVLHAVSNAKLDKIQTSAMGVPMVSYTFGPEEKFDLIMNTIDKVETSKENKLGLKKMYYNKFMEDRKNWVGLERFEWEPDRQKLIDVGIPIE